MTTGVEGGAGGGGAERATLSKRYSSSWPLPLRYIEVGGPGGCGGTGGGIVGGGGGGGFTW